jgi:hypothetical protein
MGYGFKQVKGSTGIDMGGSFLRTASATTRSRGQSRDLTRRRGRSDRRRPCEPDLNRRTVEARTLVWQPQLPGSNRSALGAIPVTKQESGTMTNTALEDLAASADRAADDQRQIARRARAMRRQRDQGWAWSTVLDRQPSPTVVELLRRSRRHLQSVATAFTTALARELGAEGATRRQIARRLGVSHQRVTALLRDQHRGTPGNP